MAKWGYPESEMMDAPALRFHSFKGKANSLRKEIEKNDRTLLVVLGCFPIENEFMLSLLEQSFILENLKNSIGRVVFRPHPFYPSSNLINQINWDIPYEIAEGKMIDLMEGCDFVFSTFSTSSVVEAAWLGLPLIICGASTELNCCPLLGVEEVPFVRSAEELGILLRNPKVIEIPNDFLFIDKDTDQMLKRIGDLS